MNSTSTVIHASQATDADSLNIFEGLGYVEGDHVYVRAIPPKKTPVEVLLRQGMAWQPPGKDKAQRITIKGYLTLQGTKPTFTRQYADGREKVYPNGLKYLSQQNLKGYGLYFIPNPGGNEDEDIEQARSIFYECDDISKDAQWERLRELESALGVRFLVVETFKSLHCYGILAEPIGDIDSHPIAGHCWEHLQQRLIQRQDSDAGIWNASRLMRLPGFLHWRWDENQLRSTPVTVQQWHQGVVSADTLDDVLPKWDANRWRKDCDRDYRPTDATGDPFDIRNFASYLDGYGSSNRRGWITCKCPAHNGESDNSLHIEETTGAFKCHAGCDSKAIYGAALDLAVSLGYQRPKRKKLLPDYSLSFGADLAVSTRYLSDGVTTMPDAEIIGLKAPKGTGKTELIAQWAADAQRNGQPVYVLTYREQLGRQQAARLGLPYKDEVWGSEQGAMLGYVLCVDSAHPGAEVPFTGGKKGALVIVDEAESVTWHLLNSSTCKKHRLSILAEVQTALRQAQTIVLADADLSDLSVDFARKMADKPDTKPFVIESLYRPVEGDRGCYSYKAPTDLWEKLTGAIAAGGHHLVLTTGQKTNSTWGTQTLERKLSEEFPNKSILRVDSQTIADPNHPAFGAMSGDIDALLRQYDIVICSPTIESGVSIDLKGHFQAVWCFATGVQPENSVRQFLARLRDNAPRHLYAAQKGINTAFEGDGSTDPQALLTTEKRKFKAHIHGLKDASITINVDGSVSANVAPLETWAKLAARINTGLKSYRAAIIAGLKQEGYRIIDGDELPPDEQKAIQKDMTDTRDNNHLNECLATAGAVDLDATQYEELHKKRAKTADERRQETRYEMGQRYATDEVEADLLLKDSQGWHPQIRLHYYLTSGNEHLTQHDAARYEAIADATGAVWLPDSNKSLLNAKVRLMEALGIPDLLSEGEYTNDSPEVIAIAHAARHNADTVQKLLGIDATGRNSNMAIVQEILSQALGFRLKNTRQIRVNGKAKRFYTYRPPGDGRAEVFTRWLERDAARAAKHDAEVCHSNPVENCHTKTPIDLLGDEALQRQVDKWRPGNIVRWVRNEAIALVEAVNGAIATLSAETGELFTAPVSELQQA